MMVAAPLGHSICRSRSSSGPTIHDEDQLHRAAWARCPLQAERRSDRQTSRDGRADERRHQSVKPLSHSTTTPQAARWRRTALAIARASMRMSRS
jgi:hypothetical protein